MDTFSNPNPLENISFSVGSNYRVVLANWVGAVVLVAAAAMMFLLVEPHPAEKHWRNEVRKVSGIVLAAGVVAFAVGCTFLRIGWSRGDRLVFDEDGAHWHTFWRNVVSAPWDDVKLNSGHRFESVAKGEVSPLIPSHDLRLLAEALHEFTAEREVVAHAFLEVETSKFHFKTEQNDLEIRKVQRWRSSLQLAELIKRRGGATAWSGDGLRLVSFAGTKLTDAEFAAFAEAFVNIPQLTVLDLRGTLLTDASLESLQMLLSLETVETEGSGLNPAAVRELLRLNAAVMPSVEEPFPFLNAPRAAKPTAVNFDFLKDGGAAG